MKKLIVLIMMLLSTSAMAHGYGRGGYDNHYRNDAYVYALPAFALGAITGAIVSQPQQVIVERPVYYQAAPTPPVQYRWCPAYNNYYHVSVYCPW